MVSLTRPQREAAVKIYRRSVEETRRSLTAQEYRAFTYRSFRRRAQPGPGCVMVPFAGMWLGIEPDGYTHS